MNTTIQESLEKTDIYEDANYRKQVVERSINPRFVLLSNLLKLHAIILTLVGPP